MISSDGQWDKYYVSVPEYRSRERLEISALYVLTSDKVKEPSISHVRGSCRFQEILMNVYRYEWLCLMRDPADVFQQVAELASALRVFRFSRPRDMSSFDDGLHVLEGHMRKLATRA